MKKRSFLGFIIFSICVAIDQVTKHLAVQHLKDNSPVTFLQNSIQLLYAENTGSWGGFGAQFPPWLRVLLLSVLPVIVLAVIAWRVYTNHKISAYHLICFTLIVAGGVGNLTDRVLRGYVVDFMYIGYNGIGTNIFNVADMVLMAGMIGLFLEGFLKKKSSPQPNPN